MKKRTLKTYATLERVQKSELDEHARYLGDLKQESAILEQKQSNLSESLKRDNASHNLEDVRYVGQFLTAVVGQMDHLSQLQRGIDEKIGVQEDIVAGKFRKLKTTQNVMEKTSAAIRDEQRRKEEAELDEIAISRFQR